MKSPLRRKKKHQNEKGREEKRMHFYEHDLGTKKQMGYTYKLLLKHKVTQN